MMSAFPASSTAFHARRYQDRLQVHAESAGHSVSDARRLSQARAASGSGTGRSARSTRPSAPRRSDDRASSCTMGRRTPTATSTSATRSTRSSRTSSSRASSWQVSTRPTFPAGTATACRSRCRSRRSHGKHLSTAETQRLARAYATDQIARQKDGFKRLGVLGDWDHPYTTMAFKNEADEIRTLGRILEKGFVYRGLKPVNWCFDCQSALAEAEVEYEDRVDIAIDVGIHARSRDAARLAAAFGQSQPVDGEVFAVIWTTTPWTIPANQALTMHPDFHLCAGPHAARATWSLRRTWSRRASSATSSKEKSSRAAPGAALENYPLPPSVLRPRLAGAPRQFRHAGAGHRHRSFVARLRHRRLPVLPPLRHEGRRHHQSGAGDGRYAGSLPFFGGREDLGGQSADRGQAARGRRAVPRDPSTRTATCIAGGTRRRSSIARRRNGSPGWTPCPDGMVTRRRKRCARRPCAASMQPSSILPGARPDCTG